MFLVDAVFLLDIAASLKANYKATRTELCLYL